MGSRTRFEYKTWTFHRTDRIELMDVPGHEPTVLAENLADIRRANRWLGGIKLTIRGLDRLSRDLHNGDECTILDVATGGADIPAAVVAWARQCGLRAHVVAIDLSLEALRLARPGTDGVTLAAADARILPFADASFDIAICSLVLHHLVPNDAVQMLREMRRVARRGVIVNDLIRSRWGYLGAWLWSRTMTRNPLTRNDAPLSVRRAYTLREMAALAAQAELGPLVFTSFLGCRTAMIAGGLR